MFTLVRRNWQPLKCRFSPISDETEKKKWQSEIKIAPRRNEVTRKRKGDSLRFDANDFLLITPFRRFPDDAYMFKTKQRGEKITERTKNVRLSWWNAFWGGGFASWIKNAALPFWKNAGAQLDIENARPVRHFRRFWRSNARRRSTHNTFETSNCFY